MAVLQVIRQDSHPLLYSLVFGEGVMNDATSIALLRAVQVGQAGCNPKPLQSLALSKHQPRVR